MRRPFALPVAAAVLGALLAIGVALANQGVRSGHSAGFADQDDREPVEVKIQRVVEIQRAVDADMAEARAAEARSLDRVLMEVRGELQEALESRAGELTEAEEAKLREAVERLDARLKPTPGPSGN
jgi:hypothetical protein